MKKRITYEYNGYLKTEYIEDDQYFDEDDSLKEIDCQFCSFDCKGNCTHPDGEDIMWGRKDCPYTYVGDEVANFDNYQKQAEKQSA